jgi:hypothetical protein
MKNKRQSPPIPSLGAKCLDTNEMDEWTVQEAAWFSYWWMNEDHTEREVPRYSPPGAMLQQTCNDIVCVNPKHLRIFDPKDN